MALDLVCKLLSAEIVTCWPVSVRIGNVKNNDPSLIEPLAAGGWALTSTWSAADYPEPSYCRDARRESQSSHFNAVTIAPPVMPEIPCDVFIQEFQAA